MSSSKGASNGIPEQGKTSGDSAPTRSSDGSTSVAKAPPKGPGPASVFGWMTNKLKAPDRLILHLNQLMLPTNNMYSILSTLSYILVAMAFLSIKLKNFKQDVLTGRHAIKKATESSSMAALGALFWRTRLTLRLFGLLPIYVKAREALYPGPDGSKRDSLLSTTAILQCVLYATSQLLENVAFLTDSGILSTSSARWHSLTGAGAGGEPGSTTAIYTLAYRAWFLGISCDMVKLFRRLQLLVIPKQQEQQQKAGDSGSKWWSSEMLIPLAWFPIGWQLTAWTEEGLPGFNIGLHGAACVLADVDKTGIQWLLTYPKA